MDSCLNEDGIICMTTEKIENIRVCIEILMIFLVNMNHNFFRLLLNESLTLVNVVLSVIFIFVQSCNFMFNLITNNEQTLSFLNFVSSNDNYE